MLYFCQCDATYRGIPVVEQFFVRANNPDDAFDRACEVLRMWWAKQFTYYPGEGECEIIFGDRDIVYDLETLSCFESAEEVAFSYFLH